MGKELKEMTLLVKANSITIADLLGIIQNQNKSLTDLRGEVQSLKSELDVLKKGGGALEKLDQEEFIVESKTVEEEEIKPEDKPFRHFEFDKSWEEFPAVKKWVDLKVVCNIRLYNGFSAPCPQISPNNPISIKESIKQIEKLLNTKADVLELKNYLLKQKEIYKNTPQGCYIPTIPSLKTLIEKETIAAYIISPPKKFIGIDLDENTLTLSIG